jgi:hypothetical protein
MNAIGDGVAVLQGTTERPGEQPLAQPVLHSPVSSNRVRCS